MILRLKIDVFYLSENTKSEIEKACDRKLFSYSKVNMFDGGITSAIEYYKDQETPDIVVLEEKDDDDVMMANLEDFAQYCMPNTKVIVVGRLNDINIYRKLITEGITEYFTYPIEAADFLNKVEEVFGNPDSVPKGKVFCFYGARGGVGSSSLAHNVAWTLSQVKKDDVILVDTDIFFGTSALSFNVDTKQNIVDALMQPDRLDAALLEKFLVRYDDHLMLLTSPANFSNNIQISIEALDKILDMLRQMAGIVILDLPHNYSPWVSQFLIEADETVVVATPDLISFRNVKNIKDTIGKLRETNPFKLVFNKYDSNRKNQLSKKDFSETLGINPLVTFSYEPDSFGEAINNGQMVCEVEPTSDLSLSFKAFSEKLSGWEIKQEKQKEKTLSSIMSWLKTPVDKK
jgi:pilus assembly protein CpaE